MGSKKWNKKRNHSEFAQDEVDLKSDVGLGATLAHLRAENEPPPKHPKMERQDSDGWTTVGRGGKKQKKTNYPSLAYSELHKLQSMINVQHLQALVLYCLADVSSAPGWVSIRHHNMVQKAVVLFVPGLDKGMFDGSIKLAPPEEDLIDFTEDGEGAKSEEDLSDLSDPSTNPKQSSGQNAESGVDHLTANNGSKEELRQEADDQHRVATSSYLQHLKKSNAHTNTTSPCSPDHYLPMQLNSEKLPILLKPIADSFTHLWPVKAPGDDKFGKVHSPLHAMLNSPLSKSAEEKKEDKKIKGPKPAREGNGWENKRTPITEFVATKEELQENEYILHHVCFTESEESMSNFGRRLVAKQTEEDGWVATQIASLSDGTAPDEDIQQGSITAGRTILAMDCEMCRVEGGDMALTRISLIEWDGTAFMDELVMPDKPIIDYLTPYSGITEAKLKDITTTLKDIQSRFLKELTPRHILIGHSLNSDLLALKLTHPFVIDTSILYPHPRGPPMKSSLKWLAQKYLNREIQKGHGTMGHDSVEDARACLDLVKLKCERGPQWGTFEATTESIFKRLKRIPKHGSHEGSSSGKTGAIIDHGAPEKSFGAQASYCIGCSNDGEVVQGIKRAVLGDEDGSYIPGSGVDFTWARFQDLAAASGWLLDYRHTSNPEPEPALTSPAAFATAVSNTAQQIKNIRDFLPPCTLFIIYSGTGDPREMARLQDMQRTFKREYAYKKWDELSVKWTDVEEQGLKAAVRKAREGVGFVTIT